MINLKYLIDYEILNPDEKIFKNNIEATYKDDEISYKDDKDSIKLIIKKDNIIMIKDNFSSETTLNFIENKKTESQYLIKSLNMFITLKVLTNKLNIEKDKINIEYEIWFDDEYSGKFKYDLYIKEM